MTADVAVLKNVLSKLTVEANSAALTEQKRFYRMDRTVADKTSAFYHLSGLTLC